ncbi:MAG: hypothetical protein P1U56_22850 [Saprospiraceae bacterium]|nr:hypothetical protein [Saprospiraceae bacterium]
MKTTSNLFFFSLFFFLFSCSSSTKNVEFKVTEKHAIAIDATHIVSAKTIFSDGGITKDLNKKGQILQVVAKGEDVQTIKQQWNKRYYDNLLHHYSPTHEELQSLSEIIGSKDATNYEVITAWPKQLTEEQFQAIYALIGQDLVNTKPIDNSQKGKYVIVVNPNFWTYTTDFDSPLLVDVISTYEREFEDHEFYHDDLTTAFYYGTLIFDWLCTYRNVDNPVHVTRLLIQQFDQLTPEVRKKLLEYNLSEDNGLAQYLLPFDRTAGDYDKVIMENKEELIKAVTVFTAVGNPPFYVVKL